jgi:DNA-binding response OmpR family regulator
MGPRVMIIDDDREMCEEIQDTLVAEGYAVSTALSGEDGLVLIEESGCDVLLLDLKMPGIDGAAVLRSLKARGIKPRILVLTAKLVDAEQPEKAIGDEEAAAMVDDVLLKPFSIPDLLAAIERLAGGNEPFQR